MSGMDQSAEALVTFQAGVIYACESLIARLSAERQWVAATTVELWADEELRCAQAGPPEGGEPM